MEKNSFQKGYNKVQFLHRTIIKRRIMEAIGISSLPSWYQRLNGNVEPRVSEAKAIEAIFADYGIEDIWGDEINIPS